MKWVPAIVTIVTFVLLVIVGTVVYGGPFWPWTPVVCAIVAVVVLMIRGRMRT